VPFHIEARPAWTARSWDGAQVPLPFARVVLCIGAPLFVPADADQAGIETARRRLEERLADLVARASALVAS
jgi:hypothetical protein